MILVAPLILICGVLIFVAWCWCASWWAAEEQYNGDGSEFDTWDDEYDYDDHLREYARDAHA